MRNGLAVCLAAYPGAAAALHTLAAIAGTLHVVTIDGSGRDPARSFVMSALTDPTCRLLVLGGASARYEPLIERAATRGIPVAVYWTSSAAQSGFEGEWPKLAALLDDDRIAYRWFADRHLATAFAPHIRGCAWLPIVNRPSTVPAPPRRARRTRGTDISLFCSPLEYGRKNVLVSLLAVAELGRRYRLHVNGLTADAHYRHLVQALDITVVDHGWMTPPSYAECVAGMDLGLQISLADSYNFVVVDHLMAGVPVVVSPVVPVVGDLGGGLARPFIVTRPDDPGAIARVARRLLAQPTLARHAVVRARRAIAGAQRTRISRARRLLAAAMSVR